MEKDIKLAEMLCTRLCHDLTGPIGAVSNGTEFIDEDDFSLQPEAMELIMSSADEAIRRLQFYRQAYGRVNDHGEANLSEKKSVADDFFKHTKIELDWPEAHASGSAVSISQKSARLLLNLLIIAGAVLIKGGTVSVRIEEAEDAHNRIDISASGDMLKLDEEMAMILRREIQITQVGPKTAQLYLTIRLLDDLDASLVLESDDNRMALSVKYPSALTEAA